MLIRFTDAYTQRWGRRLNSFRTQVISKWRKHYEMISLKNITLDRCNFAKSTILGDIVSLPFLKATQFCKTQYMSIHEEFLCIFTYLKGFTSLIDAFYWFKLMHRHVFCRMFYIPRPMFVLCATQNKLYLILSHLISSHLILSQLGTQDRKRHFYTCITILYRR